MDAIIGTGNTVSRVQPHPQCINACWLPCWYPGVLGGALCCQNRPGEALSPHPSCYLWETLQLPRSHFQLLKRLPGASKGSALPRGTPARRLPACQPVGPPPPLRSFQTTDGLGTPICHPPLLTRPLGRGWHPQQVAGRLESPNFHTHHSGVGTLATGAARPEKVPETAGGRRHHMSCLYHVAFWPCYRSPSLSSKQM